MKYVWSSHVEESMLTSMTTTAAAAAVATAAPVSIGQDIARHMNYAVFNKNATWLTTPHTHHDSTRERQRYMLLVLAENDMAKV